MGNFIENVRFYLKERGIKQNYVELMTGWEKSRISRIVNGDTDIKYDDMEQLARALGKDVIFFLGNKEDMRAKNTQNGAISFFAGHLSSDDKKTADKLIEMFRFYDALTIKNF